MSRLCALLAAVVVLAAVPSRPAGAHLAALPSFLYSARDAAAPRAAVVPALPPQCPTTTDEADFESARELLADNRVMSDLGPRPTASPAHARFIDWIERQLGAIPGFELGSVPYTVDRWLERRTSLTIEAPSGPAIPVPTSGAVPYARPTPSDGIAAPLVYLPPDAPITADTAAGKIVLRDDVPGSQPYRNFNAVAWFEYDPDLSLTQDEAAGAKYEREHSGTQTKVDDLEAATAAGAAGLIFVHGFPREQVAGQYAPYEGVHWQIPALYVGADEGERLKALAASDGRASMTVTASQGPATTRMVIGTLPGVSSERIVVESHTDGINAIWDNGPIAMLALARHFAALPRECRTRTLQFVFTTGHLYQHLAGEVLGGDQRGGSANVEADQLDRDYDRGTVAMVFALEHLGAREYAAVPRHDGGPGRVLEPTGRSEVNTIFAGESPALAEAAEKAIVGRDLARTYLLRGADAPAAYIPMHRSFGGEGSSYQQHLLPTIAIVAGPWTLLNPAFGMEAIDGELMRRQTLVFADMIHELADEPAAVLGGGYLAERAARSALCSSGLATLGVTTCE